MIKRSPKEIYEETKYRNFKSSSALEGIILEYDNNVTLDDVLEKYNKKNGDSNE